MVLPRFASFLMILTVLALSSEASRASIDIGILFVDPTPSTRLPINIPSPVTVTIGNQGTDGAQNIGVRVIIRDSNGVVYDDSVSYALIAAGAFQSVSLDAFTATSRGMLTLYAWITLPGDEEPSDNYYESDIWIGYETDVFAVAVVQPQLDAAKLQKTRFEIRGSFKSDWTEQNEVPARVQIRRCADNGLVFQADTLVEHIEGRSKIATQLFPSFKGIYDTRRLEPGCYNIAIIARHPTDGDRMNDTTYSSFSVVPNKLLYDVAVDPLTGPDAKKVIPRNTPITISFDYVNVGQTLVTAVKTYVRITDEQSKVVYRDSTVFSNWPSLGRQSKSFRSFASDVKGRFTVTTYTTLSSDEYRWDDTLHRVITIEDLNSLNTITVLYPTNGVRIKAGTAFAPRARYTWSGNIETTEPTTATFEIYGREQLTLTTELAGLGVSKPQIDLVFPTSNGSSSTGTLQKGSYTATARSLGPERSSEPVTFTVIHEHDVEMQSIISPNKVRYTDAPIEIGNRVSNLGLWAENQVRYTVEIRNNYDSLVYSRTMDTSIAVDDTISLNLTPFTPAKKGWYRVKASVSIPDEEDATDNELEYGFHFGPSLYDVTLLEALLPVPNQVMTAGIVFGPKALVEWNGGDLGFSNSCELEVFIKKCQTEQVLYYAKRNISPEKAHSYGLSGTYGGKSTADLQAGCYTALFIVKHPDDEDTSDNSLTVPFTVQELSSVPDHGESLFSVRAHIDDVSRLVVQLPYPISGGSWQLVDMLGHTVRAGFISGEWMESSIAALPSARYMLVVSDEHGAVARTKIDLVK